MRTTHKKRKATAYAALALVCTLSISSVFAYFTDRTTVTANVTGGTVGFVDDTGVGETHDWIKQLQAGPQALDNINPGDSRSLAFTVTNTGNKAIDVRHTLKLSVVDAAGNPKAMSLGTDVSQPFTAGSTEKAEMLQFDLYKAEDVTIMSGTNEATYNGGYVLKEGANPIFSSDSVNATTMMGAERNLDNISKGVVTYYFADSTLDGVGDKNETGYSDADQADIKDTAVAALTDAAGVASTSAVSYNYVLIFRDSTLNDFQGCKLNVEMVIEAKQHLNTMSSWQNIETVAFDMVVSGKDAQNSTIQTAPNNQTGVLEDVTDATAGTYNTMTAH